MNVIIKSDGGIQHSVTNEDGTPIAGHPYRAEIDISQTEGVKARVYLYAPRVEVKADAQLIEVCPHCGHKREAK